jgi:hypothetical protein
VHSKLVRHTIGTSGSSAASPGHWPRPVKEDKVIAANRVTLGGLACGLALLLAACGSGGLSDNGPFGNGGSNSGIICAWTRPGGVAHDSFNAFPNTGGTATVTKVALVHPRHLRLIVAWVVPTDGSFGAAGQGYPPASWSKSLPGFYWGQRQRIPGATVRHTRGHQLINLVIVLKPSGKVGTAAAVNLYYTSAGTRYLLHIPNGYQILNGHFCS